jgi:hypothetical protein
VPPSRAPEKAELFSPVWPIPTCEFENEELRSALLPAPLKCEPPIADPPKCELAIFDAARFAEIADPDVLAELKEPREAAAPEEGADDLELFAPAVTLGVCELVAEPERAAPPPAGPP